MQKDALTVLNCFCVPFGLIEEIFSFGGGYRPYSNLAPSTLALEELQVRAGARLRSADNAHVSRENDSLHACNKHGGTTKAQST